MAIRVNRSLAIGIVMLALSAASSSALLVGCGGSASRTQRIEIPKIWRPPPASGRSTLLLPRDERRCYEGLELHRRE